MPAWDKSFARQLKYDPVRQSAEPGKLKFLQFGETSALFYQVASRWSADTFDVCHSRVPLSAAFELEVHSRRVNLRVSRRQVAVSFASAVAAQARQR